MAAVSLDLCRGQTHPCTTVNQSTCWTLDMHNPCCLLHRVYAALDGAKKGEPGKLDTLLGMLAN